MYPFFYFYNLDFDAKAILDFVNTFRDDDWVGPHVGNYDSDVIVEQHLADDKLWTANSYRTDFFACNEIKKIASHFVKTIPLHKGTMTIPTYSSMMIKKSIKDFRSPFHPLMQNEDYDKKNNIIRTFDIIVPLQGGFVESPLQAIDTKTNEHYTLVPKGKAFMVPNDPSWHYSWCETVYDYRYTLHFRGVMPITYDLMKQWYHEDV